MYALARYAYVFLIVILKYGAFKVARIRLNRRHRGRFLIKMAFGCLKTPIFFGCARKAASYNVRWLSPPPLRPKSRVRPVGRSTGTLYPIEKKRVLPPRTVHFFYHPSQFIFYHPSQFVIYHPSQFVIYHPSQFIFYNPSQFILFRKNEL